MPLGDRLQRRVVEALAGRSAELERLEVFALGDEPLVMHIQGIPGIGKTHLLNALAASIGGKGIFVVRLNARWCEPSPAGFCRAICKEIGVSESEDPAVAATNLSDESKRTLLMLDSSNLSACLTPGLGRYFCPHSAIVCVQSSPVASHRGQPGVSPQRGEVCLMRCSWKLFPRKWLWSI